MPDATPLSKGEREFIQFADEFTPRELDLQLRGYEATVQALERQVDEAIQAYEGRGHELWQTRRWAAAWKRAAKHQRAGRHCAAKIAGKYIRVSVKAKAWAAAWKLVAKMWRDASYWGYRDARRHSPYPKEKA